VNAIIRLLIHGLAGFVVVAAFEGIGAAQSPPAAPAPPGAAPPAPPPETCDTAVEDLTTAQTQALLDPLLASLDTKSLPDACGLVKARQLARIRVGRNELVGIRRAANSATTEADLAKWRDAAVARLQQVEDAYVQLMGGASGVSVQLECDLPEKKLDPGALAESKAKQVTAATEVSAAGAPRPQNLNDKEIADAQNQTCEARQLASVATYTAHLRRLASSDLCGGFDVDGTLSTYCVTYGAFAATISAIEFLDGAPAGLKNGRLLSVVVPYAGLRFPIHRIPYLSFDLTLYSAYITTGSLDTAPAATPCGGGGNALLKSLPCETNPKIQPYASVLFGATLGQNNVGYLTLAPVTFGFARVGSQGVHPYIGMLAGTLQLTGKF